MSNRLRELRLAKGLSQSQLGLKFNVGKTTVSHYENSERDIPSDMIVKFALYFKVTTDYFLGVGPDMRESANTAIVLNAVRSIDFQRFTNAEILEYTELMKENASQILSRRREPAFSGFVKVAETKPRI